MLTEKKRQEWRKWGKEGYKSAQNHMRRNKHHSDYSTREKREAFHDVYGESYMLSENRAERLRKEFRYSDDDVMEATALFKEGYNASREWYKKADAKMQAILDRYKDIFTEAEKIAEKVDVSDIKDGFPCGSAFVYLDFAERETPLGKALAHFSTSSSLTFKYKIPLTFPMYGQCISFDERIAGEVVKFLRRNGVLANVHSFID